MRAPVSIVIPTLDCAGGLGPTLGSAFEGMRAGLVREVIFADGGSSDGTAQVADETGAQMVRAPRGRGSQLAAGVARARGDWVLVLHADTRLSHGWIEAVESHISACHHDAGWFQLAFDSPGTAARTVAAWANLRSRVFGLPYGDQGMLLPRSLYQTVGGYEPIPLMEDVALARALSGRLRPLAATAITSATKYHRDGWVRRGAGNLRLLTLYLMGRRPEDLARQYR
ncbi:MAG: TIGR04283 family arsenosugar biosynthesis glycosyltransferase [Pseudomonadota bacterium]